MKKGNPRFIAAFALGTSFLGGCMSHRMVQPAPPPPTAEQVTGTWFGISSDSAYRLDLASDGTGTLVTGFGPLKELQLYVTDKWELKDHDLTATFLPMDSAADPLYLRARADRLYYSEADLRNVIISLSEHGHNPVGDFIREPLLQEWLDLLTPPMEP